MQNQLLNLLLSKVGREWFCWDPAVVQRNTAWLMIILENILDLKSNQADIVAAIFPATLWEDEQVYIEKTLGFKLHVSYGNTSYLSPENSSWFVSNSLQHLEVSKQEWWKYTLPLHWQGSDCHLQCQWYDFLSKEWEGYCYIAIQLHTEGINIEQQDKAYRFLLFKLNMSLRQDFSIWQQMAKSRTYWRLLVSMLEL